jgi:hypothetical protein
LAAAAALVIASVGVYFVAFAGGGKDVLAPLYRQTVAAGFKPETVCTTDAEFANWCRAYMRQPVFPVSHPNGVEFVGWNLDRALGPGTGVLLAKVGGKPVIVVMNRTDRQDTRPSVEPSADLNIFRKRLGNLVLFEVTPDKVAEILPTLSADKPK